MSAVGDKTCSLVTLAEDAAKAWPALAQELKELRSAATLPNELADLERIAATLGPVLKEVLDLASAKTTVAPTTP